MTRSSLRTSKIGAGNAVMAYYTYDNATRLFTLKQHRTRPSRRFSSFSLRAGRERQRHEALPAKPTCPAGRNVYYAFDALDRPDFGGAQDRGPRFSTDSSTTMTPLRTVYFRYDEVALKAAYWTYDAAQTC